MERKWIPRGRGECENCGAEGVDVQELILNHKLYCHFCLRSHPSAEYTEIMKKINRELNKMEETIRASDAEWDSNESAKKHFSKMLEIFKARLGVP